MSTSQELAKQVDSCVLRWERISKLVEQIQEERKEIVVCLKKVRDELLTKAA